MTLSDEPFLGGKLQEMPREIVRNPKESTASAGWSGRLVQPWDPNGAPPPAAQPAGFSTYIIIIIIIIIIILLVAVIIIIIVVFLMKA